jgi:hypothetical protein
MTDPRDQFIPYWLQAAMRSGTDGGLLGGLPQPDPPFSFPWEYPWPHKSPLDMWAKWPSNPSAPSPTFSSPPLEHLDSGKYWPVAPAPSGAAAQPSDPASWAAPMTPLERPAPPPDDDRRGVLARTIEGFTAGAGTAPLGFTPQHRAQYPMLQALQPFAAPIDLAMRLPVGIIGGAAGGGAGLYEYFTGDRTGADRLQRDLGILGQTAMVTAPSRLPPGMPRAPIGSSAGGPPGVPRPAASQPPSTAPNPASVQAPPTSQGRLFDYSRLHEVPNVPQFNLERYVPARGVPAHIRALDNPNNLARINAIVRRGIDQGGTAFYNNEPLREWFVGVLGPEKGQASYTKFMNIVAATSPRTSVEPNIRNASYYYNLSEQGDPLPVRVWDGSKWSLAEPLPKPYGHRAQALHASKVDEVLREGGVPPLRNPKSASFAQNLQGNQTPVSADVHNTRLLYGPNALGHPVNAPPKTGYGFIEQLQQREAAKMGLTPAQYQSAAWFGGASQTGVRSKLVPWLQSFENRVALTAAKHGLTQEEVLRRVIRGEIPLISFGGAAAGGMALPQDAGARQEE